MPEALSPFQPGTHIQFAWDSTSLGWFKSCPRKYYYSMIRGLRKRHDTAPALSFGLHYHKALETYDRLIASGSTHEPALREVVREAMIASVDLPADEPIRNRFNLIRTIIWYLEEFRDDPAKTLILANGKPAVELSFRLEIFPNTILCGHMDRVVEFLGDHYVMDRKTTTTIISSYYFERYNPDNQMTLYTAASQIIYQTPVKGVIIDAAQTAIGFSKFARAFTYRTPDQVAEWLGQTHRWIATAQEMANHPRADEASAWPMNDKSCHDFGGCPFRPICSKAPSVRESFLATDYITKRWNPLEVR